jgi:YVTN family beta-propeller protein
MSNTVSMVDTSMRKVVDTLKTGVGPTGMALSKDGLKLYVANAKDNTVGIYDLKTKKCTNEIRLPLDVDFPGTIQLMPDGKRLILSSESTDAIGIFNVGDLQFEAQPIIGHTSDELIWAPIF